MIEIQIDMQDKHRNVAAAHLLLLAGQQAKLCGRVYNSPLNPASQIAIVQLDQHPIEPNDKPHTADFIIMQNEVSLNNPEITRQLNADTGILLDSTQNSTVLSAQYQRNIITLPAEGWAELILGRKTPDTALLAAFVTLTNIFPSSTLADILRLRFKGAMLERNLTMMNEAVNAVTAEAHWIDKCKALI